MAVYLITDAELLDLGLGATALASVLLATRTTHRGTASALVLSRLAVRFEVPADWAAGDDVKRAVAAIAAGSLLGRRGYQPGAPADPIAKAYDDAIKWLDLVVAGDARPAGGDALTERRGPLVAGTDGSRWASWRSGGTGGRCCS
jgi:hypothetical protein